MKPFRLPAAVFCLQCFTAVPALAQSPASPSIAKASAPMTASATGTFEVSLKPLAAHEAAVGRMSIDKQFSGQLSGSSKGEMLAFGSPAKGSGGYVAMELVTGSLNGKSGSFVLQHTGTMDHGGQQLSITIVPDSGTGELAGISGKLDLKIADGKHFYDIKYSLAK